MSVRLERIVNASSSPRFRTPSFSRHASTAVEASAKAVSAPAFAFVSASAASFARRPNAVVNAAARRVEREERGGQPTARASPQDASGAARRAGTRERADDGVHVARRISRRPRAKTRRTAPLREPFDRRCDSPVVESRGDFARPTRPPTPSPRVSPPDVREASPTATPTRRRMVLERPRMMVPKSRGGGRLPRTPRPPPRRRPPPRPRASRSTRPRASRRRRRDRRKNQARRRASPVPLASQTSARRREGRRRRTHRRRARPRVHHRRSRARRKHRPPRRVFARDARSDRRRRPPPPRGTRAGVE